MGDLEFEEFKNHFEDVPQHIRAPAYTYTLAHAITPLEENKSFLEKVEFGEKLCGIAEDESFIIDRSLGNLYPDNRDGWRNSPTFDSLLQKSPRLTDTDSDNEGRTTKYNRTNSTEGSDPWCDNYSMGLTRAESDLVDVITEADRERIMETERTLMESSMCSIVSGDESDGEEVKGEERRLQERRRNRRRRRLPEIPKNKRPLEGVRQASLFEELNAATPSWTSARLPGSNLTPTESGKKVLSAVSSKTKDVLSSLVEKSENSSLPPSLILNLVNLNNLDEIVGEVDSGNSTSNSPDESYLYKKDKLEQDTLSPISPSLNTAHTRQELLDPTHRGLHRFLPRHQDEIELEIGDPVYVQKEAEDLWCEGINLRTGRQGIFPLAHVVDVDYNDFDPAGVDERKERYLLDYLGSVQCAHKGVEIIIQAVTKMSHKVESGQKTTCILEIGDKGIKMVDKSKPGDNNGVPCHEYFFSLKNVTFCGFHPRDHRYFGFVTKHPTPSVQKYACHVFISDSSTRCVAEAYGRAFQRFYKTFIETAFPTEDIYLE